MEMWGYGILALLSVAVILLGGWVLSLRHAVREIAAQLDTKLHTDTNTTLSLLRRPKGSSACRENQPGAAGASHTAAAAPERRQRSPTSPTICARR